MVFGVQKPPFCNAKRGFLRIVKYPAYTAQNIYRVQMYGNKHPRMVYLSYKMYISEHTAISIFCANVSQRALRKA